MMAARDLEGVLEAKHPAPEGYHYSVNVTYNEIELICDNSGAVMEVASLGFKSATKTEKYRAILLALSMLRLDAFVYAFQGG